MIDSLSLYWLSGKFIVGILIFVRITGMMASGPFLKSPAIPMLVKVMLAAILSIMVTSMFWTEQPDIDLHLWNMVLVVFKEFFLGLMLGFVANFIFFGARMAGGLVDTDMGFQTAMIFDQSAGVPTLLGELFELIALMLFLLINGHHYLIEGIFLSVKAIPISTMTLTDSSILMFTKGATTIFIIAFKMASPLIVSLFLTNLTLTILARVAPQTNIFALSFQVKVTVGLLVLMAAVPIIVMITKFFLADFQDTLYRFLLTLNKTNV